MGVIFGEAVKYLRLKSDEFVRGKRIKLQHKCRHEASERTKEHLRQEDIRDFDQLLEICSGLVVWHQSVAPIEISFCIADREQVWTTIYPNGIELSWCTPEEDLLILDLDGSPRGLVYHVSHDPPSHTICFGSLVECLRHLIESEDPLKKIVRCVTERTEWPTVAEFSPSDDDLQAFLSGFPAHYWVHDLRRWTPGAQVMGFPYFVEPHDITRHGREQVWVQKRPKGFFDRMKLFWRTGEVG